MTRDDTRLGWLPAIFALGGLVWGAALDGESDAYLGLFGGLLIGMWLAQRRINGRLQARVQALESAPAGRPSALAPVEEPAVAAGSTPWVADDLTPAMAATTPDESEAPAAPQTWTPPPAPIPVVPRPPNAVEQGIAEAWAWLRGGNPLAKVGVVILFFGAVFLIKYAAEHSLFPIELRFAALGAGAVALLVLGWRLRLRRPGYAQVLQGGGVAGLYLVTFAAARLYHLLPLGLALAVMVAVAVLAAILAVAQNALAMAVIGTGGGFLAPLLVLTGSGNHVALFTYYAILNLGVFTVAWFRAWRVLNLLGLVFTFGIVGVFRGTGYADEKLVSTDGFLLLFFAMYVAVSILFALRQKPELKSAVSGSMVFGLPVATFGIHASLVHGIEFALAWSALGFGAFYLLLATVLWNRRPQHLRLLCEAFAALGVIFTSLAVPLAFDERATAAMWAVEGAGLMWLGVRQDRKLTRAFAALLLVGGAIAFLIDTEVDFDALPVANGWCFGLLVLALSALLSGHWLRREGLGPPWWEQGWAQIAVIVGTGFLLAAGLGEIERVLGQIQIGAALAWFALLSVGWQALSRRLRWPLFDHLAVGLMAIGAVTAVQWAFTLYPQQFYGALAADLPPPLAELPGHMPSVYGGWFGWPLWFVAQYRLLWRREPAALLLGIQHAATGLLLLTLLAWEAGSQVQAQLPQGFWLWLPTALLLGAALVLLRRDPLAPRWPLAAHALAYRRGVGWPVAVVAVLWLIAANLTSRGTATPLPTLPLLNPLDLASIGLLLASLRFGLQPAARSGLPVAPRLLLAGLAALVFLWMNSALVRGLHYGFGTPLFGDGALRSVTLQAALSVFWSLVAFAVMLFASKRALRIVWLAGAALMAVVVGKLFLVDTAGSGTLARIVAFFTVGGVLLVTGYFSPLPPAKAQEPAST